MNNCQECESDRIASVNAKCSDACYVEVGDNEHDGYVPDDMNIGGGDYVRFEYCLECGQIQGDFPVEETEVEQGVDEDDDDPDREEIWPSEHDSND